MILAATIFAEFFQLIALGPDSSNLNEFIVTLGNALVVDLEEFVYIKNGMFWTILTVVFGVLFLWLLLWIFNVLELPYRYPSNSVVVWVKILSGIALPAIGHIGYIPIIAILLDVLVCDETSGDDLDDSFLARDCY
jgi:hypothetical protein